MALLSPCPPRPSPEAPGPQTGGGRGRPGHPTGDVAGPRSPLRGLREGRPGPNPSADYNSQQPSRDTPPAPPPRRLAEPSRSALSPFSRWLGGELSITGRRPSAGRAGEGILESDLRRLRGAEAVAGARGVVAQLA